MYYEILKTDKTRKLSQFYKYLQLVERNKNRRTK